MSQGWVRKKLVDVCVLQRGFDLPKRERKTGKFPLVSSSGYIDFHAEAKVKGPGVVTGRSGSIGQVFYIEEDFWPLNTALYIKDFHGNDPSFIAYLLQSFDLNKYASGAGVPTLNRNHVHDEWVVIPVDIEEQKRIVAILDQAFADIEQARTKTEQNLKNARELFGSSLQEVFRTQGYGWERVSLLELLDRNWITSHLDGNHGGDYPRKSEFVESGVPYISAKCLVDGEIDMSKAKYLTEDRAGSLRKGIAKNGDVLFAHNATVGPVAILATDQDKVILGTSLTYYRCNNDYIIPEYLSQYMISYEFTSQYTSIMRQSTRNQVPITKQREFIHVIPPISEQADIAKSLIGLSEKLKSLEKIYLNKLSALEELKKSILQKAFAGELANKESKGAAA